MDNKKYLICFFSIGNENNYKIELKQNGVFYKNLLSLEEDKQNDYIIITYIFEKEDNYYFTIEDPIPNELKSSEIYRTEEFKKNNNFPFEFNINPLFKDFKSNKNFTNFEILILVYNYINNRIKNKLLNDNLINECKNKFILNQLNKINEMKQKEVNIELLFFIKILILLYEQYEGTKEKFISWLFINFYSIIFEIQNKDINVFYSEEKAKIDNFFEDLNENSEKYNYIKNQIELNNKFSNQIEILIIFYYRFYNFDKFVEFLLKNKYFDFVKINKIGNFNKEEYSKIISKIEDVEDLKNIFKFFDNYNDLFNVLIDNENKISNILNNSNIKIKHYEHYNTEEKKIDFLYQLLYKYKKIYKYIELNNYNFINDLIKETINLFEIFEYDKNYFDEFIEKYKLLNENLPEKIKDEYLEKIFDEIKNSNKWNNLFIIKFIFNDQKINKNKYKKKYSDIFKKINVQKINKNFVNLWKEYNFLNNFDDINDIKVIFKIFLFKTKDFLTLNYLLELFIDIKEIDLEYYFEKLNDIISNNNNYIYYKNEPLSEFLSKFLNKLKENNKENEIEKIYHSLSENIIDKDELINLFCFLYENFENEKILNIIIKILNANKNLFIQVLEIIKDISKRKKFLEKLNNEYIINDNDFFDKEISENFQILYELNEKNEDIFNQEEFSNYDYIKKTKEKIKKIKENIRNENLNYNQIKLLSTNNIFNRIKILFITESLINKKNEYYKDEEKKIESKINEIKDYYNNNIKKFEENLNVLIKIYKKYFFNEKDVIEKLEKIKEVIEKGNFGDIKKIINESGEFIN